MSLKELSEATGLTENRLKKYEECIGDMEMTAFMRVCKALGVKNPNEIIYIMD